MIKISPKQKKRLLIVTAIVLAATLVVLLTLFALTQNINLFYTPSDLSHQSIPKEQSIRMGGLVVPGSVVRGSEDLSVTFELTDTLNNMTVHYTGILPDLFREDQGIVVLGHLQADHTFLANEVLAKHDENYMPTEVAEALQRANAYETKKP